jgi:rhamnosyltransferase
MKNKIETSIVIRTHNHKELLKRLLKKIKIQKKFKNYEILVIDSSSTDGTAELAKEQGCKVVKINSKDFSHAYTFNLGAEKSKGKIIFYVSVDIIPKNDSWAYYIIKHFKDEKVAGVFSKQEPIPNFNSIEEFKMKKIFPETKESPAHFSNASGAIRKAIWKKIKYDEGVPYQYFGGEDQKLALEAKKRGYKIIYEPKSIVYHSHKYSMKKRIKEAYQIGLNEKKVRNWEREMFILEYKKSELIKYLIKKRKIKEILVDLIFVGVLMRIASLIGRIRR